MEVYQSRGSFLLRLFRDFYREVARLKRTVEYSGAGAEDYTSGDSGLGALAGALEADAPGDDGPAGGSSVLTAVATRTRISARSYEGYGEVQTIWQPLLSLLERQAAEAGETGGAFAYEVYREAQYVMAALADEVFLHLDWDGRQNWPLLETRLFQTHIAGEEVFSRLDLLLQRNDPFYADLASVYFLALSLGFKGKYRGLQGNRLTVYRQQLFTMVYRRNPKLFSSSSAPFPQAYQNVMQDLAIRKLPSHWVWLWLIAGVLAMWIGISQYAWSSATSSISCLMCNLLGRGCVCETGLGQMSPAPSRQPPLTPPSPREAK